MNLVHISLIYSIGSLFLIFFAMYFFKKIHAKIEIRSGKKLNKKAYSNFFLKIGFVASILFILLFFFLYQGQINEANSITDYFDKTQPTKFTIMLFACLTVFVVNCYIIMRFIELLLLYILSIFVIKRKRKSNLSKKIIL